MHERDRKERNVVSLGDTRESCGLTTDNLDHPKLLFWLSCLSHIQVSQSHSRKSIHLRELIKMNS